VRRRRKGVVLAITVALAAACSGGPSMTSGPSAGSPTAHRDKLAQIQARGTLVLPVDPAYPPASFGVEGATRGAGTACASNQLTAAEVDGYDVATGKLVAEKIGVEPCFVTPTWVQLLSGHWGDRWDIAFSSIGITTERMKDLYFTRPYYATPERFYVRTGSSTQTIEDLDGRRIGVCSGCFADLYLQKRLDIPGQKVEYQVDDAVIVPYSVERGGLEDVSTGKLDAFLCQETAGDQAINEGLLLRAIDPAPYAAFPAGAVDRSSGLEVRSFVDRVNGILAAALQDGSLSRLSTQHFGTDYASPAASFDVGALHQTVR
jgi:polar amino acid transport system substrate-binding protein